MIAVAPVASDASVVNAPNWRVVSRCESGDAARTRQDVAGHGDGDVEERTKVGCERTPRRWRRALRLRRRRPERVGDAVRACVRQIVRASTLRQAVAGLLSTSPLKTIAYVGASL